MRAYRRVSSTKFAHADIRSGYEQAALTVRPAWQARSRLTLDPDPRCMVVMRRTMNGMTIGQLADSCDVSRDTLRFYERKGLLPTPKRSSGGYRLYQSDDAARVRFVRRAQAMG